MIAGLPVVELEAVLAGCLSADVTLPSGVVRPDYRTRLDAAKTLLSYSLGRPPEGSPPPAPADKDDPGDLRALLERSPAVRRLLGEMVRDAEQGAGKAE